VIRSSGSTCALLVAAFAILGVSASAYGQQSDAPPAAAEIGVDENKPSASETILPAATHEAPSKGISLELRRHAVGSTHFERSGPRSELISETRALDVVVGERAVAGPIEGGKWTLIAAGPYDEDPGSVEGGGVIVVTMATDEAAGKPLLTIDNRLDRPFYVPPIIIYARSGKVSAQAGKGCNIAPGVAMNSTLDINTLSFVLANVEKSMDVPTCGPSHILFPDK
jgi:hypothetical protein